MEFKEYIAGVEKLQASYRANKIDKIEFSRQMSTLNNSLELSDEERTRVQKDMKDTQPKVKAPKRAFHGSSLANMESIDESGIWANKNYGDIFLCDTLEDCLKFLPRPCVIYEVDTKQLLPKRWRQSLDHKKEHYNCDVYCYFGDIPASALKQKTVFEEEE